jgi:hypothetical protein
LDSDINIEITRFNLAILDDPVAVGLSPWVVSANVNERVFRFKPIESILSLCLKKISNGQTSVDFMKQNIQQLTVERDCILKEFESLVNEKISIENDLYSKVFDSSLEVL